MKKLNLIILLIISPLISHARDKCELNFQNAFFENLEGEPLLNPKNKTYTLIYQKYDKDFYPDAPSKARLVIPYAGDCSKFIINEVNVFRYLGKVDYDNNDHESSHKVPSLELEKKPAFTGKKEISIDSKNNLISLKTFKIFHLMDTVPEDTHAFRFKFDLKYKDENDMVVIQTIEMKNSLGD